MMFRNVFHDAFSLKGDTASHEEIKERIESGAEVKGTNMCILVVAIFIASIGLNMDSTAVIIGAMLISPLMGGIMAIGYGAATGDFKKMERSAMGLGFQILVSLITSTIYFMISPVSTASSELLARTNPTIYDVLIAVFGGIAGCIGITRKEKSNVIPGVAIATALMPPLCTAGYGLAMHSLKYFLGAMYLFVINTYFICFTTCVIMLIIDVPKKNHTTPELYRKLKKRIITVTIIMILPSFVLGYQMVQDSIAKSNSENIDDRIDTYGVERISTAVTYVFPNITDIKVGYFENYNVETKKIESEMVANITVKERMSEKEKENLGKWLKIELSEEHLTIQEQIE